MKYLALFRAINISGRNIILMKELVKFFEQAGYLDVKSYIQTGNIIFTSPSKSTCMKFVTDKIEKNYHFLAEILTICENDLVRILSSNPFIGDTYNSKDMHIFFLFNKPKNYNLELLNEVCSITEKFQLVGNALFVLTPGGIWKSKLARNIEKVIGVKYTARNWNTVLQLHKIITQKN